VGAWWLAWAGAAAPTLARSVYRAIAERQPLQLECPYCHEHFTPDLEGRGQARATDPATSHAAAQITVRRGSQRWKVLEAVKAAGEYGATSWELVEATGIPYTSLTPRIGELKRGGLITVTDRRRPSQAGVDQEVVVAGLSLPDVITKALVAPSFIMPNLDADEDD
jgi:hypothetical protein